MLPAAAALAPRGSAAAAGGMNKAVVIYMLGDKGSYSDRFKMARDAGFDGIEAQTVTDPRVADEIRAAAAKTGIEIHSVMNMDHWRYPLSSPDPEEVKQSVAGMEASLRNAKLWGADTVLLVPAVVNPKTGYRDAWARSQKVIRERILPLAKELKIVVGIEEVWNKFLLSPIEFKEYVDSFKSPWIKAYLDVGNMLFYGYPQDWIRTLGKRIVKVHVKDFMLDRSGGKFYWKNLGEGDIDWPEVRKALGEVGYQGYITAEIEAGDAAYLKDVAARMDRIIAGQPPVAR
ncbi:MAG: sugar phosphate isomerase/epimerase [Acidobacteria bacterium]|nr:sugar phosphate isomerase/epimerase [Acidobacteriota bacterium]